mgnify:CR=1 FL=1
MTAFRLADMIEAFQLVLDTPKCYGKSPNGQQRTDSTGVSPQLTVCQSRPHCLRRIGYRSDCDWTGVSLSSLWVMAKSGAARYFESIRLAHHLSIARCLSAGLGVPLHTLMLITITKRKYLANGYSIVKELSRFRHTKENRVRVFLFSHPVARGNIQFSPLLKKLF